jgi:hypothetical protein
MKTRLMLLLLMVALNLTWLAPATAQGDDTKSREVTVDCLSFDIDANWLVWQKSHELEYQEEMAVMLEEMGSLDVQLVRDVMLFVRNGYEYIELFAIDPITHDPLYPVNQNYVSDLIVMVADREALFSERGIPTTYPVEMLYSAEEMVPVSVQDGLLMGGYIEYMIDPATVQVVSLYYIEETDQFIYIVFETSGELWNDEVRDWFTAMGSSGRLVNSNRCGSVLNNTGTVM